MASGTLGGTLRHLRDLFDDGTAVGLGDAQLLARYIASRDEAAFEALVARHGPMVLATCRAVLRHEHDVEDAFQATFLILARKARSVRAGDVLGGWLHRVAYRASAQVIAGSRRRREAEAEATASLAARRTRPDPEVAAVVHEELDRLPDRHRLPVILCDLEGMTYEQAAARLRWSEPTLRHRLVKARGRLRERLTRRGVTAGALGAVLAAQASGAKAAVPAALARSAVATAAGETAPAAVAALSATIIRSMTMTRLKIVSAGLLGALAMATAGVVAVGAGRTGEPGRARLMPGAAKGQAAARPAPPGDAKAGQEIEGRIVDLEGRPVAGARIHVVNLWSEPGHALDRWLERARDAGVNGPWEGLSPSAANLTAATDADGRFRLAGVGPEQLAEVLVSGPTIATAQLLVLGRDRAEVRATNHQGMNPTRIVFHPRRFDYAAAPGKAIEGIVRDQDTGRALAGITLRAGVYEERSLIPDPGIETRTDAQGHYRLAGLPKAPAYRFFIDPADGQPYPKGTFRVAGDTPAFQPVTFDWGGIASVPRV